ncbi:hypothetical protein EJ08DRAFT_214961 [Tothia fuscella]|uniref:Zn(2)-C6 fungal-type domain-containing protein n=1 Tax=Tothia fuscella TaxID=1048955 RepID=A0A9P4TXS5_9PEZI|nr:hypothetical protein EJ08DRAFT_214961 [Tothia fuscella]
MVSEAKPKRRTWTRSKRGCKTCRIRHIKCDETYPACKQCTATGRTCDGFAQPSTEWRNVTVSSTSPYLISPCPKRRPNCPDGDAGYADICFSFFEFRTVDYLTGLLGQEWKPLMLQAVEQNDAVYHAMLAMGSMHKTISTKQTLDNTLEEDIYAVQQYTRAMRILVSKINNDGAAPVDVVLTACILFIGFESLRRNARVVMEHIRSGVRVIRQHQDSKLEKTPTMAIPLHHFVPAFARLERQLQEFTGEPTPLIQDLANEQAASGFFEYATSYPQPVPYFESLNHAWFSLHQRWHALVSCTGSIHLDWFNHLGDVYQGWLNTEEPGRTLEQHLAALRQDFQLWSLGLDDLGLRMKIRSPKEISIFALLQCHTLLAYNILRTAVQPKGLLWDDCRDQFQQMVDLCRIAIEHEILEARNNSSSSTISVVVQHRYAPSYEQISKKDPKRPLTFEMSVGMIILHVITKCRNARIRLDAIKLLEDYPRIEGLWDGAIIAKVGRAVDVVERQGRSLEDAAARGAPACEISLSQRILDLHGGQDTETRSANLVLHKLKGEGSSEIVTIIKTITW